MSKVFGLIVKEKCEDEQIFGFFEMKFIAVSENFVLRFLKCKTPFAFFPFFSFPCAKLQSWFFYWFVFILYANCI